MTWRWKEEEVGRTSGSQKRNERTDRQLAAGGRNWSRRAFRLVEGARVKRTDLKGTILLADIGLLLSASFRYLATVISLERGIPAGQKRSYLPLFQS